MTLELPYPPSINNYYGHTRTGQVYIKKHGKDYRNDIFDLLREGGQTPETMQGRLYVEIDLFPPDNRKRDIDNPMKCLLDSLEKGGAYVNDAQIFKLVIEKKQKVLGGKCLVRIRSIINK